MCDKQIHQEYSLHAIHGFVSTLHKISLATIPYLLQTTVQNLLEKSRKNNKSHIIQFVKSYVQMENLQLIH